MAAENGDPQTQEKAISQDDWQEFLKFVSSDVEKKEVTQSRTQMRRVDHLVGDLLHTIVSKKKVSENELKGVLQATVEKFVETVQAQMGTIYFVGEKGSVRFDTVYYSPSLYGDDPKAKDAYMEQARSLEKKKLRKGQGIVGLVVDTGKPHIVENAYDDPHFFKEVDKRTGFVTRSLITVPIRMGEEVIGAFQAANKNPDSGINFFTQRDFSLLQEIADYSAKIIQKVKSPDTPMDEVELSRYLAKLAKCEFLNLEKDYEINDKLLRTIGADPIKRYKILPLKKTGKQSLSVAMANPLDLQKRDMFQLATGMDIEVVVVSPESQIEEVIEKTFAGSSSTGMVDILGEKYTSEAEEVEVEEGADEESAPIVRLASMIIEDAYSQGASDIHVEPFENETLIRYRVDGVLHEKLRLPRQAQQALISRLKIMSELKITERRLPQDGRIMFKEFTKTGVDVDLRIAFAPMMWGEKVVIRILDKTSTQYGLDAMGFSKENLEIYRSMIHQPWGMVLHVGPTGSGKTTTLYAALTEINKPDVNIQTAEDPIEYMLHGINQMHIQHDIGLTFAAALRAYLRQDPDIIMVGEIRDRETADIAIEAALTGHLLFSTLHTNDAPSTAIRLIDMGVQPFLVSSSVLCVVAQRLMRRLCTKCKEPYKPTEEELKVVRAAKPIELHKKVGCSRCSNTGFKGRIGIHEILRPNDELKGMINKVRPTEELQKVAVAGGMVTLFEDAMEKVRQGITSLEEALRVVRED